MKHEPISKQSTVSPEQMQAAIDAAPDRVDDPDSPYDPNDEAAVAAFWAKAEVRTPGKRGQQKVPAKIPVSIRLNADVVEYFKRGGEGWQTRLNDALERLVAEESSKAA